MSRPVPITDDAQKRIDILLKEYDTLREEILARTDNRFNLLSVVVAVLAFLASVKVDSTKLVIGGIAGFALAAVIWWRLGQLISSCGLRLRTIEAKVNALADESLLEWETKHASNQVLHSIYAPDGEAKRGGPMV